MLKNKQTPATIYTAGDHADYNYNAVWTVLLIIIVKDVIALLSCVAFLQ